MNIQKTILLLIIALGALLTTVHFVTQVGSNSESYLQSNDEVCSELDGFCENFTDCCEGLICKHVPHSFYGKCAYSA